MDYSRYISYYKRIFINFFISAFLNVSDVCLDTVNKVKAYQTSAYYRFMYYVFGDNIVYVGIYIKGKYRVLYDYRSIFNAIYILVIQQFSNIDLLVANRHTFDIIRNLDRDDIYYVTELYNSTGIMRRITNSTNSLADEPRATKNDILFVSVDEHTLYTPYFKLFTEFLETNNTLSTYDFLKLIIGYSKMIAYASKETTVNIVKLDEDKIVHELVFKGEDIINIS